MVFHKGQKRAVNAGRGPKLTPEDHANFLAMDAAGMTVKALAYEFMVSKQTAYLYRRSAVSGTVAAWERRQKSPVREAAP